MKIISDTRVSNVDSFRFRDSDTFLKGSDGKPMVRPRGFTSEAEANAIAAGKLSPSQLGPQVVQEFGAPRSYHEKTVSIAGMDITYRAPADGPDKMRSDDFEAYVSRLTDRLYSITHLRDL